MLHHLSFNNQLTINTFPSGLFHYYQGLEKGYNLNLIEGRFSLKRDRLLSWESNQQSRPRREPPANI